MIDVKSIYDTTLKKYRQAKNSITIEKRAMFEHSSAISDTVPGYSADTMNFGAYEKDNFGVLFIDMHGSTTRAESIGAEKTFLTMHAFIPAMLEVVKYYNGNVIDIMGDGMMVFFGGKHSKLTREFSIQNPGLCGRDMLKILKEVVNKILYDDGIKYSVDCGVGIDHGDVIITKIGINDIFDVKAFGDCINKASKYSHGYNEVKVSKFIRHHWPTGENGTIKFTGNDESGYILGN